MDVRDDWGGKHRSTHANRVLFAQTVHSWSVSPRSGVGEPKTAPRRLVYLKIRFRDGAGTDTIHPRCKRLRQLVIF